MEEMFHLHEHEFYIRSPKYSVCTDQRALHTAVIYELKYPIQGVLNQSRSSLSQSSTHASNKMGYIWYIFHRHSIVRSTFMSKCYVMSSWRWRKYSLYGCAYSKKGSNVNYSGFFFSQTNCYCVINFPPVHEIERRRDVFFSTRVL